jgi:anaerobic magnesium-protoporphyrin IX monomethyl ester cyclase
LRQLDVLFVHTPMVPALRLGGMGTPKLEQMLGELQYEHRLKLLNVEDKYQFPYQVTDVGLLSLSSYMRQAGFATGYFLPDKRGYERSRFLETYCEQLEAFLRSNEVRHLAFGPYTCAYPTAQAIARRAKVASPNTRVIFGGQHATFLDSQILNEAPFVDFVVRREGERPLESILRLSDTQTETDAPGTTCRRNGEITKNPDSEPLRGSEIPPQDYESLPSWLHGSDVMMNIPTGRGCPWRCFFCTEKAYWGRPRQRSAAKVAEEIKVLSSKLHIKEIRFSDDTFAFDKNFLRDLVTEFRNHGIDLPSAQVWTRVDTINQEALRQISELAENVEICYGVESGSEEVLKAMRKGITIEQVIQALRRTREQGIYSTCFWIVGHPRSSPEKEKTSTDLMCKLIDEDLCSSHEVSVFQPYPGSEAFRAPQQSGVIIDNYEWNRYSENPPVFPPASHLVNFSPIEIMLAYLERRARHYEHLCKQMGVDPKAAFEL